MKVRNLWIGTALLILASIPHSLLASLGSPDPIWVTQPNGVRFQAMVRGDEHLNWLETLDGFTFCKNRENGFWEYAQQVNQKGKLIPSGHRVGEGSPVQAAKGLRPAPPSDALQWSKNAPGKRATWDPQPQSGVRNILVVLVAFSDREFSTQPDAWQRVIFGQSPADKSVVRHYRENSFGKVDLRPVQTQQPGYANGMVYTKLNRPHPNYGRGDDLGTLLEQNDAETEWINQALTAIEGFVDFPSYDFNGNGRLTTDELNVYFVLAGYDASVSSKEPNIWAHAWSAFRSTGVRGDGLPLENWAVSGELHDSDQQNPFGVIAHELGHSVFGLPDLYDTAGNNSGLGLFSLMASGSFGRLADEPIGGMTPGPMDPWSRYFLGWSTPRMLSNGQIAEFPPGLSHPTAPVILPAANSEEFFLVENFYPDSDWHEGLRTFLELPSAAVASGSVSLPAFAMRFSPAGNVSGVAVRCGLGKLGEFPSEVSGQIALIQRGEITFQDKVVNARNAGAKAVIVFNNQDGAFSGTLGEPGEYVPAVGMAPSAVSLEGQNVDLSINTYPWSGGLMVLHVDPTNGSLINDSEQNDVQGVLLEEASNLFGSLISNSASGHVTHLFSNETAAVFSNSSIPNSQTHLQQDSKVGLSQISAAGPMMTARVTQNPSLSFVLPWIVNNAQWNSRVAFFNSGTVAESPLVVAVDSAGQRQSLELPEIAPGAVKVFGAASLFADLSGYSLSMYASKTLLPSFLTFNQDAPSGASPAQTTGYPEASLSDRLVFGYLPSSEGGTAALVLVAPEAQEEARTQVAMSLHDGNGVLVAEKTVELNGNSPFAALVSDLFGVSVEEGAVIATSQTASLSGTTFTFNAQLEPAMALPFANDPQQQFVLPWIVNNATWSSRISVFNQENLPATVQLLATNRSGQREESSIQVPAQSLWSSDSTDLFPGLTGYSLVLQSDQAISPNFLAFNKNAASGRSPAQSAGSPLMKLTDDLIYPYVPFTQGGVSALVLVAPLTGDDVDHSASLSLYNGSGNVLETVVVPMRGKQPFAAVISDVFSHLPEPDMTVSAKSTTGELLAGTTFVFNGENEPSMATAVSR